MVEAHVLTWLMVFSSALFVGLAENIQYIGCYNAQTTQSQETERTSWLEKDDCFKYCKEEGGEFALIKERLCSCLNKIPASFHMVDDSSCLLCAQNHSRSCGSNATFSLYFMFDRSHPRILITTLEKSKIIAVNEINNTRVVKDKIPKIQSADYNYVRNAFVFVNLSRIIWVQYSDRLTNVIDRKQFGRPSTFVHDIVIDWYKDCMYWAYSDAYEDGINCQCWLSKDSLKFLELLSGVQTDNLAIDPYERLLFFTTTNGSLVSFHLETNHSTLYDLSKHNINKVSQVAVDHHSRHLYLIVHSETKPRWDYSIVKIDYDGKDVYEVYGGGEVINTLAEKSQLEVFDNLLLWGDTTELYMCEMSMNFRCRDSDVRKFDIPIDDEWESEHIVDVKFYNPFVQTPSSDFACKKLNCSHHCTVHPRNVVSCSCPEGMKINTTNYKDCEGELTEKTPMKTTSR